jgi:hypothetical protein
MKQHEHLLRIRIIHRNKRRFQIGVTPHKQQQTAPKGLKPARLSHKNGSDSLYSHRDNVEINAHGIPIH